MNSKLMKQLGIVEIKKGKKFSKGHDWDVSIYVPFSETTKAGFKSKVNVGFNRDSFVEAFGDGVTRLSFGYTEKTGRIFIWIPDKDDDGFKIADKSSKDSCYVAVAGLYDILKDKYFTDTDKKYFTLQYSDDLGEYYIDLKENKI